MREYSAAAALARYPVTVPSSPGYGVSEPRFDSTMYAPLSTANAIEPPIPCNIELPKACSVPDTARIGWKKRPSYCSSGGK